MFVYLTRFKEGLDRLFPSRPSTSLTDKAREKGWPTTHRLTGVHFGEVGLQLPHSPLQKAADGLVGVFLVGGLDDEGHRVLHHALVHAAHGPSPALTFPGDTTLIEPSQGLRAGSAAGGELPGGTREAHPHADAPGTAATRESHPRPPRPRDQREEETAQQTEGARTGRTPPPAVLTGPPTTT